MSEKWGESRSRVENLVWVQVMEHVGVHVEDRVCDQVYFLIAGQADGKVWASMSRQIRTNLRGFIYFDTTNEHW